MVGAVDNGGVAFVGVGIICEISALSAQFYYEPKTALSKVFGKKMILQQFSVEQPRHCPLNEVALPSQTL